MATDPQFGSVINNGSALLGAAETNLQVPTTTSIILTAGASGTRIEEIVVEATATTLAATTVAGLVYIFLYDGTTYHLYDVITVTAITASASAAGFRQKNVYTNLWIKTGWSLRASQSAQATGVIMVSAFGGDL